MKSLKLKFLISYLHHALLILVLQVLTLTLNGQEDSASVHSIYANTGLGTNMIYMGSSISGNKPYYYGSLIYGFKGQLYASASAYNLSAFDRLLSFSAFSLNFSHTFNSWFDIAMSASRYQVNKELVDTLFTSFFYGDVTMGFDWKLLYTKISVDGIFSGSSAFYYQIRNSRYFETPAFLNKKASVSFDPYVNLLFGTLTRTTEGTTVVSPPYHGGKSGSGGTKETKVFSLMEVDLGLPVSFNIGRFTIDAEPGYAIPLYTDPSSSGTDGFVFTMGITFRIL